MRRMVIKVKTSDKPYTQYYLVRDDAPNNIEVYVLKKYLHDRLGIFG